MAKKNIKETAQVEAGTDRYELVVVYPITENEIACERAIQDKLKKEKFEVVTLDKWGVKNLAYPIKKQLRGYYLRFELKGDRPSAISLEKSLQMDDKLLRYLLLRTN
jgi:small subunit ribosomal protein S6